MENKSVPAESGGIQADTSIREIVIKPLECFLRLAQLAAKETLSEDEHFDYVSMLTFAHSMAEKYLGPVESGGQADLLQAVKYFVSWVDDVWGSAALSPRTLAEYEQAKLAIKNYEEVAKHAPLAQRDERAEFEKAWDKVPYGEPDTSTKHMFELGWKARAELVGAPLVPESGKEK